jgi:tRNA/rRNA methyltransferase
MKLPYSVTGKDRLGRKRFSVVLVRPENPENIGLVARAMKNTGFSDLKLVGLDHLEPEAHKTAIHSEDILDRAHFYPNLEKAIETLHLVFASTARSRKTFSILTLEGMVETLLRFPKTTRIGLLFGNERTGLTSEELGASNFIFSIPQASRQPSYNLASAVLLTLFALFVRSSDELVALAARPIPRKAQEDCIGILLRKLEQKGFIHRTNKTHIAELVRDLFGRIALTDRDRRLLLALFDKTIR